ncbi:MAG: NAD-dependent succinate-semialdehyde dehydrogenase [Phycisphaeraceae bacterium]|nr:MAG: NAD-dependent succinate-semialdehyde dehydrogenase [Phycisphaeraceae bacterium]
MAPRSCLIGAEWVGADSGETIEVRDPATDELVASVPGCAAAETRRAIDAAAKALPKWRSRTAQERTRPLRRLYELMMRDRERLALLMTREQGKPLAEARGEIAYAASFIEWAAEEAKRIYGLTVPASSPDKRILVLRQPVGVCAAITPWNFPAAMITRKLGPALAAGCAMVVKPAEQTPLSALALGELALEAEFPPGVVNIVTGDAKAIAGAFFDDPRVRKLSFTGSTEVGRSLMKSASDHVMRLSLELGGHAPLIVFDDADLEAAAAGAVANKMRNMGQTCICANRILVQRGVYDEFVGLMQRRMERMKVGAGSEQGVEVGPLIDDDAVEKVKAHVADALDKGATVRTGGGLVKPHKGLANRFYAPTIIEGITSDMRIWREETFGPVAPVRAFDTEDEAIKLANDSIYGLAAYFYTRDASRLMRVAEALEYGVIGANDAAPSTAQAPFGGVKQSGVGREGGRWGVEEYTELKFVSWGGVSK